VKGTLRQEIDRVFNRFFADPVRLDLLAGERSWPAFDVSVPKTGRDRPGMRRITVST